MGKELLMKAIPYIILAIVILYIFNIISNKVGSGFNSALNGDLFKSKAQKETDEKINNSIKSRDWFAMEKRLPFAQRTTIKKNTSEDIANRIHSELRHLIQTPTGANSIYEQMTRIKTLGSLYQIFGSFGVRDGMDMNLYLYNKVGFNNIFSKDLNDINKIFKSKNINYQF